MKIPGPELVIITDGPDPERYALSSSDGGARRDAVARAGPAGVGQAPLRGSADAGQPRHRPPSSSTRRRAPAPIPGATRTASRCRARSSSRPSAVCGWWCTSAWRRATRRRTRADKLAFRAALEPEMIAKVDDTPLPPPPKPVLPPQGGLAAPVVPVASIPATPAKPKKKKTKPTASMPASRSTSPPPGSRRRSPRRPPRPAARRRNPRSAPRTPARPVPRTPADRPTPRLPRYQTSRMGRRFSRGDLLPDRSSRASRAAKSEGGRAARAR